MPGVVGESIQKRLPTLLGPADQYDVHVDGNIIDTLRGKIDSIEVQGKNVALSPSLHVAEFDAKASDIHVNTRTEAIESIATTSFEIGLSQANIDNYLQTERSKEYDKGARIILNDHDITYSNKLRAFGFITTSYQVTGILVSRLGRPNQMDFIPSKASVARLGLPIKLVRFAIDRANPVVDLTTMKYPVSITSAKVSGNVLHLSGTVNLAELLAAANTATANANADNSPAHG